MTCLLGKCRPPENTQPAKAQFTGRLEAIAGTPPLDNRNRPVQHRGMTYTREFLNHVMPEVEEDVWRTECGQYTLRFIECEPDAFVYVLTDNWAEPKPTTREFVSERSAQTYVARAIYGS
jgi:hypothetical protein